MLASQVKKVLDVKRSSIKSPLLFVWGDSYVKSIRQMSKGSPIESPLLFVCSIVHVKSIRQMSKRSSIGSHLFVCGVAHIKSIRQMSNGPSIGIPLLFVRVGSLTLCAIESEPLASIGNTYC
jgi:hypothetical protein